MLITGKDVALRQPHKKKWVQRYIQANPCAEKSFEASANMWSVYETQISDPAVADIIQKLEERGIPSLALTAGWNGQLAKRPFHCDDRIDSLRSKGIDFSYSFPKLLPTFFKKFENFGKNPSYKQGVLFACMLKKSDIIHAFLEYAEHTPKEIVFVDDQYENIEDIGAYCARQGYNYHGIHYRGVEKRHTDQVNEKIAHMQFQTLLDTGEWLNDEVAEAKISSSDQGD